MKLSDLEKAAPPRRRMLEAQKLLTSLNETKELDVHLINSSAECETDDALPIDDVALVAGVVAHLRTATEFKLAVAVAELTNLGIEVDAVPADLEEAA